MEEEKRAANAAIEWTIAGISRTSNSARPTHAPRTPTRGKLTTGRYTIRSCTYKSLI